MPPWAIATGLSDEDDVVPSRDHGITLDSTVSAAAAMDRPLQNLLEAEMPSARDNLRPARDQYDEQLPAAIENAIAKATQRRHAAPAEYAASASHRQAT